MCCCHGVGSSLSVVLSAGTASSLEVLDDDEEDEAVPSEGTAPYDVRTPVVGCWG